MLIPYSNGSCTTYRKCMLPTLRTWHFLVSGLFQRYKRRCSTTFTHSASRWLHEDALLFLNSLPKNPELNPCTYVKIVSPAFHYNLYSYASCSFWTMTNQNVYPSDSTPRKIINLSWSLGEKTSTFTTHGRLCRNDCWTATKSGGSYVP